jgi:fatty-acyl-CoA synthase
VTSPEYRPLVEGLDTGISAERTLVVGSDEYTAMLAAAPAGGPDRPVAEDDLFLLIFTSGSTGLPKAVRCTQGRFARTGGHVARIAGLTAGDDTTAGDVVYSPLPFFHSSAGSRSGRRRSGPPTTR